MKSKGLISVLTFLRKSRDILFFCGPMTLSELGIILTFLLQNINNLLKKAGGVYESNVGLFI